MLVAPTIPKNLNSEPALDHEQLFRAGLAHVQRLASRVWNDYNVHDPGITTLELLSYALTDLSYRATFPVADLLTSANGNPNEMKKQFFTARQILPNRALTLLDYRKLLIDLKDVRNAWLRPAALTYYADTIHGKLLKKDPGGPGIKPVHILGLYDVILDYNFDDDTAGAALRKKQVLGAVRQRLQANRNLCEDFVTFRQVETQNFLLCCELELSPEADVSKVEAEIFFEVEQYLCPAVRNYTRDEMLARRKADGTLFTVDEIFNGPELDCGFIDDEELAHADLRAEIYLSDVISIIMDIKGVRAVRDIVVNPEEAKTPLENKWIVPVLPEAKAALVRKKSRLVFYKRNRPVTSDENEVVARRQELEMEATAKTEKAEPYDLEIPLGSYRQLATYYSFQNHFPALYGLTESGLSSGADDKRKTLAYQLKAYLLFFDQIMANYLAQLGHLRELLSAQPALKQTYVSQLVDSFADSTSIYKAGALPLLEAMVEDENTFGDRRNRFLDHLIARVAEQFTDLAHVAHANFGTTAQEMIGWKCDFLSDYPAQSSGRSLAYNYTLQGPADLWDSGNVAGLERRLAKLLCLRNFTRRNLGVIAYDIYAEVDTTPDDEFRWRVYEKGTPRVLLSSSTKYVTRKQAKLEMQAAIGLAQMPSGYQRKTTIDGQHYFNIVDAGGEVVGRRIQYFDTAESMNKAIAELMEHLRQNYSDEGMYLIEMILLRPEQTDDPFLPICADPNCLDCTEEDPYSYRLHVILPAYSSRFSDMEFRRFVEEVIRQEMPAHILPRICWVNQAQMATLEKEYRAWIYLKAGVEPSKRTAKLEAFIETLSEARNVYKSQRLHGCGAPEGKEKFLLGKTALGTITD